VSRQIQDPDRYPRIMPRRTTATLDRRPSRDGGPDAATLPIRVVAERTGVATTTLRAWERRYRVVQPGRTSGAQRLYSDADVERLRLIARLAELGYPVGQLARSSTADLEKLRTDGGVPPTEDVAELPDVSGGSVREAPRAAATVERMMRATHALDPHALRTALTAATKAFAPETTLDLVVSPFLREVGRAWSCAALTVGHEHLASNVVRDVLGEMLQRAGSNSPRARSKQRSATLIATTLGGEYHEFGALMAAIVAARLGWRVLYLGANLPAQHIARIASETNARAIVLGIVNARVTRLLRQQLAALRAGVGDDVALIAGGASTAQHQLALKDAGVRRVASRDELRAELDTIWTRHL
jgi:DNA-binding transcriptional MerR regulator/methylmalonyl-CoA mutase cobalamin-binding subunit